ncbi:MAG: hypothetical protein ACYTF7_11300 [Planctomycetota bacterium]|jgi:hypothetical protein
MKYKTQVRLAVRLIGLLVALLTVSNLISLIVFGVIGFNTAGAAPGFDLLSLMYFVTQTESFGALTCIYAVVLFFRPNHIVNKLIPSNKSYCPECGYQLARPIGTHCTECGTALPNNLRGEVNEESTSEASSSE